MKVFKFGGASVKDVAGIKNLLKIVSGEPDELVLVISAFGKTTNAMEKVLNAWISADKDFLHELETVYNNHYAIVEGLFPGKSAVKERLNESFETLKNYLSGTKKSDYDFDYDQIVSFGEIWSTMIVSGFLEASGLNVKWIDIRQRLITDDRYRDANVQWEESTLKIKETFSFSENRIYITQGFIGGTVSGQTTTLGREGSDYTAAILGNILDAEKVVVWKDVPGLLNADPKWLPDAEKLEEVSYKEAVEMTFSGAKVIHPKTIKPLHNKNIPLHVKSFINPEQPGTIIKSDATLKKVLPIFIKKENQILISILPKDFSFVMGENLSSIFHHFLIHGIKVNLVEASAVSIDVCVNDERTKVEALLADLEDEFTYVYNENLEILSVRHQTPEAVSRIIEGREILLEQKTRSTARFIVRSEEG